MRLKNLDVQLGSTTGFLSLLTVLLIGLKLTGHIGWSWWWVLAPIWVPFFVFLLVLVLIILILVMGKR